MTFWNFPCRRTVLRAIALATVVSAFPSMAAAHEFKHGALTVDHPWTRATTVMTGAAYMTLKLTGTTPDRLVKVTSPDAERVEIHTMAIEGGVARMREMPALEVKPGAPTQLKPGGVHLMMVGLRRPLREGESIRLSLTFEKAGTIVVDATVEKAGAPRPGKHAH